MLTGVTPFDSPDRNELMVRAAQIEQVPAPQLHFEAVAAGLGHVDGACFGQGTGQAVRLRHRIRRDVPQCVGLAPDPGLVSAAGLGGGGQDDVPVTAARTGSLRARPAGGPHGHGHHGGFPQVGVKPGLYETSGRAVDSLWPRVRNPRGRRRYLAKIRMKHASVATLVALGFLTIPALADAQPKPAGAPPEPAPRGAAEPAQPSAPADADTAADDAADDDAAPAPAAPAPGTPSGAFTPMPAWPEPGNDAAELKRQNAERPTNAGSKRAE